jgi:exodeoxyribonuclease III
MSIKIVTWNVNGIRSRVFNNKTSTQLTKNKSIELEENTPMKNLVNKTDADIICLQETRCDENNGKLMNIHNYISYWNSSKLDGARGSNRYSGTGVYTKIKPNKIEYTIPGYDDQEGRIMILYFNDFILINVYVPNSGSNYETRKVFNKAMLDFFSTLTDRVVFCGDMNMAIDTYFDKSTVKPSPGIYPHELKFYDDITTTNTYGGIFKDTMDKKIDFIIYTWWNPKTKKVFNTNTGLQMGAQRSCNHGWRLDYIFTRGFKNGSSKVLKNIGEETDPQGSDHAPVFGTLEY